MKRLYPLSFVFPVPSRHALNLLLFVKNDDNEDTLGAFNSAESILFIVKKMLLIIVMLAMTKIDDDN